PRCDVSATLSGVPPLLSCTDGAASELSTLSLHDALPICSGDADDEVPGLVGEDELSGQPAFGLHRPVEQSAHRRIVERTQGEHRSEEHTSELQSRFDLVCRLLLEKKKKKEIETTFHRSQH